MSGHLNKRNQELINVDDRKLGAWEIYHTPMKPKLAKFKKS
jgi:hypothetical protein